MCHFNCFNILGPSESILILISDLNVLPYSLVDSSEMFNSWHWILWGVTHVTHNLIIAQCIDINRRVRFFSFCIIDAEIVVWLFRQCGTRCRKIAVVFNRWMGKINRWIPIWFPSDWKLFSVNTTLHYQSIKSGFGFFVFCFFVI